MTHQEDMLKQMLKGSGAKGEKLAAHLDSLVGKLNTAENQKAFKMAKDNPLAAKAAAGDTEAMTAVLKSLLSSPDGQKLVQQVQELTKE